MLSGFISLLFLVSVLDDATHNTYWILSVAFAAASLFLFVLCTFYLLLLFFSILSYIINITTNMTIKNIGNAAILI